MSKRPLALFLFSLGVVAISGAVVLVMADSWLHEPGAQLFGVRPILLIWVVVLLEAPILAVVSARFNSVMGGFIGTIAGAAAMTCETNLLGDTGFDVGVGLVYGALFIAGLAAIPVALEFWVVVSLWRVWERNREGSRAST
jgi:hypothetical protein